jgi:hypothetical protein
MYELFRFLSNLIPAAVILLPILFYYLHKRNILRTKKEILLKEIENGSIVDPEMLAKSLTNPVNEEQRLQSSLRCGIIFTIAGMAISVATIIYCSYMKGMLIEENLDVGQMAPIFLIVALVLVVAVIVLGVGIAFLVSYFNQKKRMNKTA